MMQPILKGNDVVLRPLRPSDAGEIYRHLKDKKIKRYTSRIPHPYTLKDAKSFLKGSIKRMGKGEAIHYAITHDGVLLVGIISLVGISKENKNAELGYWLAEKQWGKGIMTQCASLIVQYGFSKLKLHKICSSAIKKNSGSIRVLEKNGFVLEGTQKDQIFRFGKWQDLLQYGLINPRT